MLFDQGVDPTSLLRRSEGEGTAMQCNLHSLQMIVFIVNTVVTAQKKMY